jgi:ribonuclease-3
MGDNLEALEVKLDHRFSDRELLQTALTHRSLAFEEGADGHDIRANNEQMEFLGDAILGFLVSEALVARLPASPEGHLSKCKARMVSANHLHGVARRLDLGAHLLLGKGEEMSGGRDKRALLANALEAVIAAIYLDAGLPAVRSFVAREVVDVPEGGCQEIETVTDFKSALQEWTQARTLPMPRYRVVATSGPEHSKTFTIEARIGDEWREEAEGSSKKAAGQRAAQKLLAVVQADAADAQQTLGS